ncbi:ABC transporter permease [Streptomyces sp. 8L]|uniref:ABC transporter permease n=1 Tax=Streptomyces sp. 8L TaxID=2877242 RepID=UPI001CD7B95A|nr:ABC transporter permease subunit [Streptomyces sp. 8L]MCA1217965.1 ABC transporter permease subunit [Streptomyces sp. 8L]
MTAPYPPHAAQEREPGPQGGYVSPIPVRRAHLGDAIVSEWTKIRSVRSTVWTLGGLVLSVVGIGLVIVWAVASTSIDSDRSSSTTLSFGFFGVLLGTVCVVTLGVLTFSSEFSTGLIRTTLTACPSRARVLTAKATVYFTIVFTLMLALTLVTSVLQVVILDTSSPPGTEWISSTVGVSLYMALLGVLAQALGALVKHAAGAITAMLGVVLLPLVLALFLISSLEPVGEALLTYSIPSQLASFYPGLGSIDSGPGPGAWVSLWIVLVVTALAMGGAYTALDRRDA